MTRYRMAAITIVGVSLAAELAILLDIGGPLQAVLGLALVLGAPGAATLLLLGVRMDLLMGGTLVVAISLSVDIVVSLVLFYADWWAPDLAVSILVGLVLTLVGLRSAIPALANRFGTREEAA